MSIKTKAKQKLITQYKSIPVLGSFNPCDAPATCDIENDPLITNTSQSSKNIETDTHTDFTFSSKGLNISNLSLRHIVAKIDEIRISMSNENSPHILGLCDTSVRTHSYQYEAIISFVKIGQIPTNNMVGFIVLLQTVT